MRLYELKLFITSHACKRYCERVEAIPRPELEQLVNSQIQSRDYRRSGEFIHIAGVWWCVEIKDDQLRLVSCYGKTEMDIPAALEWAKINRDRIVIPNAK